MSEELVEVHLHNLTCPRCGHTLLITDDEIRLAIDGIAVRKRCQCGNVANLRQTMEADA
jgi:hypothetical protein